MYPLSFLFAASHASLCHTLKTILPYPPELRGEMLGCYWNASLHPILVEACYPRKQDSIRLLSVLTCRWEKACKDEFLSPDLRAACRASNVYSSITTFSWHVNYTEWLRSGLTASQRKQPSGPSQMVPSIASLPCYLQEKVYRIAQQQTGRLRVTLIQLLELEFVELYSFTNKELRESIIDQFETSMCSYYNYLENLTNLTHRIEKLPCAVQGKLRHIAATSNSLLLRDSLCAHLDMPCVGFFDSPDGLLRKTVRKAGYNCITPDNMARFYPYVGEFVFASLGTFALLWLVHRRLQTTRAGSSAKVRVRLGPKRIRTFG